MTYIDANIANSIRKGRHPRNLNELISLVTILGLVSINTWVGFVRYLGLEKYSQDILSFQTLLFSRDPLLGALPFIWGFVLWLIINWIYGLFCREEHLEPWQLFANICFGEGISFQKNIPKLLLGFAIPYVVFFLYSIFNNLKHIPLLPYLIIITIYICLLFYVVNNFNIHKKSISLITKVDLQVKCVFYYKIVPILLVFSIVLGLQVIPEGIGKLWGLYRIYSIASENEPNLLSVNISSSLCWGDSPSSNKIYHFMDFGDHIIYIRMNEFFGPIHGFPLLLSRYLITGEGPEYQLCVISPQSIKINGEIQNHFEVISSSQ